MTLLNPQITDDPVVNSWTLQVTQQFNDQQLRIEEAQVAAAALSDLESSATLADVITRVNELRAILEDLA